MVASGLRTMIAGSLSSCIAGFHQILEVLTIIRPATLVLWHRAGFRCLGAFVGHPCRNGRRESLVAYHFEHQPTLCRELLGLPGLRRGKTAIIDRRGDLADDRGPVGAERGVGLVGHILAATLSVRFAELRNLLRFSAHIAPIALATNKLSIAHDEAPAQHRCDRPRSE